MKRNFDFTLTGKAFFPLFYSFFLIIVFYETTLFLSYRLYTSGDIRLSVYMAVIFGGVAFIMALSVIYQVLFARKVIRSFTFEGLPFGFNGKIGEFFGINLLGAFLTAITAGIYFPWFARKIHVYMTGKTVYRGTPMEFVSKGGKLFLILLACVVAPILLLIVLLTVVLYFAETGQPGLACASTAVTMVLLTVLFLLFYKYYQWYFNGLAWNSRRLVWKTRFFRSVFFMIGQVILTLVTAGIYWPAALVKLYRYFANRTRVKTDDRETGNFLFEGKTGEGFLLIWGQFLLSVLTAFIYFPWAFARIVRWFSRNTVYIKTE